MCVQYLTRKVYITNKEDYKFAMRILEMDKTLKNNYMIKNSDNSIIVTPYAEELLKESLQHPFRAENLT